MTDTDFKNAVISMILNKDAEHFSEEEVILTFWKIYDCWQTQLSTVRLLGVLVILLSIALIVITFLLL